MNGSCTFTNCRCFLDAQVTRASEPWEYSDGAVYLVRELCLVSPEKGVQFFEEMADMARLTQFVQADCLRETIWKQVMEMKPTSHCQRKSYSLIDVRQATAAYLSHRPSPIQHSFMG